MKGTTKNRWKIVGATILFLMLSSIATVYATTISDTLIDTEGNLRVGTILEGIWQGTPISDDYIEDNITAKTSKLTQDGAAPGQVPKWDGTKWVPAADDDTDTTVDGCSNCLAIGIEVADTGGLADGDNVNDAVESSELDNLCSSDGMFLKRTAGVWTCGSMSGSYLPITGGTLTGPLSFTYPGLRVRQYGSDLYIEGEYDSTSDVEIEANDNIYLDAEEYVYIDTYSYDITLDAGDDVELYADRDVILEADSAGNTYTCVLGTDGEWWCDSRVTKNARFDVNTDKGIVDYYLYATEGTKVWFVDEGTSKLENSEKTIVLDKEFQLVISNQSNVRAFVTPKGKCNLYVTDETWNSFKVVGWDGPEKEDCEFNWRVSAVRIGFDEADMEDTNKASNIDDLLEERYNLLFD